MTTLILMRHGETLSNIRQIYQGQGDGELSPLGIEQARHASRFLKDTGICAVYCSDLQRAVNTAKMIAKPHGLRVRPLKDLRERFYGKWEGKKFSELEKEYGKLYKLWLVHPNRAGIPGAEKLRALQKRGVRAIEKIVRTHRNKTVLVVAHGGMNRAILFSYLGLDLNSFWKIRQENCCINIIRFMAPYPKITLLNSTSHLGKERLKENALS